MNSEVHMQLNTTLYSAVHYWPKWLKRVYASLNWLEVRCSRFGRMLQFAGYEFLFKSSIRLEVYTKCCYEFNFYSYLLDCHSKLIGLYRTLYRMYICGA